MVSARSVQKACPTCGSRMSEGSVRLTAKSGIRGAKIDWMDQLSAHGEVDRQGATSTETLANFGTRDVMVTPVYGLRFPAWRCAKCKIVAFTYPQGNNRW
jgi:hypothetical protein